MHHERGFAWRRRAFERCRRDAHNDTTAGEIRQYIAERERACDGVELVAGFDQARSVGGVQIGSEGHHQDVCVERSVIGHHPFRHRID